MGVFSWMYCDSPEEALRIGGEAWLISPRGEMFHETSYSGYGRFDRGDIYKLVARWNRDWIRNHPDTMLFSSRQKVKV